MECKRCESYKRLVEDILGTIEDYLFYGDDYSINPEWNEWYKKLDEIEKEAGGGEVAV